MSRPKWCPQEWAMVCWCSAPARGCVVVVVAGTVSAHFNLATPGPGVRAGAQCPHAHCIALRHREKQWTEWEKAGCPAKEVMLRSLAHLYPLITGQLGKGVFGGTCKIMLYQTSSPPEQKGILAYYEQNNQTTFLSLLNLYSVRLALPCQVSLA